MAKIRKGDTVIVLTGKDKKRTGTVKEVLPKEQRVIVEGINMVKKHLKPNPQKNQQGGIVDMEASMHISNVALLNQNTNKADRVGYKIMEDGRKLRCFKSNNEIIDVK